MVRSARGSIPLSGIQIKGEIDIFAHQRDALKLAQSFIDEFPMRVGMSSSVGYRIRCSCSQNHILQALIYRTTAGAVIVRIYESRDPKISVA